LKKFIVIFPAFFLVMSSSVMAQTLQSVAAVDFGSYDFGSSYNVQIQLGTDGNAAVIGTGVAFGGGESAGHIRVTEPDTGIVEVKCTTTAELTDPTATSLTIENIEIAVSTGVSFGNGSACDGIGGGDALATTIDMDANPDANIYIGGEISIPGAITLPTDHAYNTTGTGTPITISIITQ